MVMAPYGEEAGPPDFSIVTFRVWVLSAPGVLALALLPTWLLLSLGKGPLPWFS